MNKDTLNLGEIHPSATSAMYFVKNWLVDPKNIFAIEAIASSALSGNRICEICWGTLERIEKNEPISDRYLLGLAWFLKEIYDEKK